MFFLEGFAFDGARNVDDRSQDVGISVRNNTLDLSYDSLRPNMNNISEPTHHHMRGFVKVLFKPHESSPYVYFPG